MSKRPLVFLDTETTGLGPGRLAWEVALVRRDTDGFENELQFFLPVDVSRAEPGALDVGRFYQRHPQGITVATAPSTQPAGPPVPSPPRPKLTPLHVAAEKLAAWTAGATIVGANPMFDTYTVERLLRSHGFEPRWHYRTRDVESMAVGFTGDEDLGGLAACAAALGVTVDPNLAHTAMGDARVAMGVYDALILGDVGLHNLAFKAREAIRAEAAS